MKRTFVQAWALYKRHVVTLAALTALFYGLEKAIQFGGLEGAPQGGATIILALMAFLVLPAWMDVTIIRYLMGLTGHAARLSIAQCLQPPAQPLLQYVLLNALILLPFAIVVSLSPVAGLLVLPLLARLSFAGFEIVCRDQSVSDAIGNSWRDTAGVWTLITAVLAGAYLLTHLMLGALSGFGGSGEEAPDYPGLLYTFDYLARLLMVYITVWLYRLYTLNA